MTDDALKVLEGVELQGRINTTDDQLQANIQSSIRRGYPQIWPQPLKYDTICLVGGGPSLNETIDELRDCVFNGAKLVAMNGAYQWLIDHNFRPSAHIVLDAQPHTARFLTEPIKGCRYYLASQCHPDTWDRVDGREQVGIFHAVAREEQPLAPILDKYYLGQWTPITGGTTVAMRSLALLRTLGYVRFELFGVDSCWLGQAHHAFDQPENAKDKRMKFTVHPTGHPEAGRVFYCSPAHLKQLEDFLQLIRINGQHFRITIHGDGLLAYVLHSSAELEMTQHDYPETISL